MLIKELGNAAEVLDVYQKILDFFYDQEIQIAEQRVVSVCVFAGAQIGLGKE